MYFMADAGFFSPSDSHALYHVKGHDLSKRLHKSTDLRFSFFLFFTVLYCFVDPTLNC